MTARKPSRAMAASDRLLIALCEPTAMGCIENAAADEILVVASSKGVRLKRASAPRACADALVNAGLAQWRHIEKTQPRQLLVTAAGRSRAVRLQTTPGVDPFLAQNLPLESAPRQDQAEPLRNAAESPLAWLARRKGRDGLALIDAICLAAGERLRMDVTFAKMLPNITSNWSANADIKADYSGMHFSERAAAARQRVDRALDAVGDDLAGLVLDVCAFLKGLEQVEAGRGWPQRSARVVLVIALKRLAAHYGLAPSAQGLSHSTGVRRWGAPDYRPALNAASPG